MTTSWTTKGMVSLVSVLVARRFVSHDHETVLVAVKVRIVAILVVVEDKRWRTWRNGRCAAVGCRYAVRCRVGVRCLRDWREFDANGVTVDLANERVSGRRAFGRFQDYYVAYGGLSEMSW